MIERCTRKLREIGGMTPEDKKVIDVSQHYDMLMRKAKKTTGFRSLSVKDPMKHKNWKFFLKLLRLCEENGWDTNLYLDYTFIHAQKYWVKVKYPMPNMLCSENIQKSFAIWKEKEDRKYSHDLHSSERKGSKTISYYEEIRKNIKSSVERLKYEMNIYSSEYPKEICKVMAVLENLDILSSFYLYSIDYVRNDLINNDNESMKELLSDFKTISKSKKIQEFILDEVKEQEKLNNIPINISLEEFNKFAENISKGV